ncbi:RNA-directed DNA polymerase [Serratia ureilytica]|uniref:reverse transcriptase family protein n=1 Tax=Serratia ureilytica TaxID=300181 RepID=UPI0018691FB3|nr:reverse transcriptase family protein [Serratia ureilytica]MBH3156697.1 RNA-directed DNA polymerase [Serratia ureilytica]MBH3251809.1 RNA-directed DNA polymerase [Serratia ureilytica]
MTIVPSHLYYLEGIQARRTPSVLSAVMAKSARFHIDGITYIHNLQHLVKLSLIDKKYLNDLILRKTHDYEHFSIKKKSGGHRYISAPKEDLKRLQQWVNFYVLKNLSPHSCCYSYHKNSSIYKCALAHCSSKWLIKLDIENFFDMTSELSVYKQFKSIGYSPIVSFALTRICTYQPKFLTNNHDRWILYKRKNKDFIYPREGIKYIGRLPQGAPTSPMLSNMVFYKTDELIYNFIKKKGGIYTRYADDIFISFSEEGFTRDDVSNIIGRIMGYLKSNGYSLNKTKIKISPPGTRKTILSFNVNESTPKLSKEFKKSIESHLYALNTFGPVLHAQHRGFDSVYGMLEHIKGKIFFAKSVHLEYGIACFNEFNSALEKHGFN